MNMFQAILPVIALMAIASPATAQQAEPLDQQDGGVHGIVIAGVGAVPDYEGADGYRIIPLVGGTVRFDNRYIALEGLSARANILNSDRFEFGPVAHLTLGRRRNIDSAAVASLGRIDDAYEVGAFAATNIDVGKNGRFRFAVEGVHDVSQVHNGWLGTATIGYAQTLGSKWRLSADAAITGASGDYARRYFSITPAGAATSGLTGYNAKGGIKDVSLSLGASYRLSPRWSLNSFAGYKRLVGSIADSPVVAREGSANQFSGGFGVGFSF